MAYKSHKEKPLLFLAALFIASLDVSPANASDLIEGARYAKPNEFLWVARILASFSSFSRSCAATLIENQWLLTTAHCVTVNNKSTGQLVSASSVTARIGIHDISDTVVNEEDDFFNQLQISTKIFIHDSYKPDTLEYNFALSKLKKPVILRGVIPISLPLTSICRDGHYEESSNDVIDGCTEPSALGWGTSESSSNYYQTSILKVFNLKMNKFAKCQGYSATMLSAFSDDKICATSMYEDFDTCGGDEGGPLFCRESNSGYLMVVGVASYSARPCNGFIATPGVFSRVCKVIEWIKSLTRVEVAKPLIKTSAVCAAKSLPTIDNGFLHTIGNSGIGSIRMVFCNEGFTLIGANNITCGSDGVWTQIEARCQLYPVMGTSAIMANAPTSTLRNPVSSKTEVDYNIVIDESYSGSKCTVYDYAHSGRLTLNASGIDVFFGDLIDSGFSVTLRCNDGFRVLSGADTITCLDGGTWSSQLGICFRARPTIKRPIFSNLNLNLDDA